MQPDESNYMLDSYAISELDKMKQENKSLEDKKNSEMLESLPVIVSVVKILENEIRRADSLTVLKEISKAEDVSMDGLFAMHSYYVKMLKELHRSVEAEVAKSDPVIVQAYKTNKEVKHGQPN